MRSYEFITEDDYSDSGLYDRLYYSRNDIHPTLKKLGKNVEKLRQEPEHQYMGSGYNAYAYKKDSQHELNTVRRVSSKLDGGAVYHQAILKNPQIQNNPFIPRIWESENENGLVQTQMEKLYPIYHRSIMNNEVLMRSLWELYFNIPYPEKGDIPYEISEILDYAAGYSVDSKNIESPSLIQALEFIAKIAKKARLETDIHSENIMWRISGYMPQLVIIDPIHNPRY